MLDDFIATNATAHKVNSYYTLAISYCTFCVGKHTVLGPGLTAARSRQASSTNDRQTSSSDSDSGSIAAAAAAAAFSDVLEDSSAADFNFSAAAT